MELKLRRCSIIEIPRHFTIQQRIADRHTVLVRVTRSRLFFLRVAMLLRERLVFTYHLKQSPPKLDRFLTFTFSLHVHIESQGQDTEFIRV